MSCSLGDPFDLKVSNDTTFYDTTRISHYIMEQRRPRLVLGVGSSHSASPTTHTTNSVYNNFYWPIRLCAKVSLDSFHEAWRGTYARSLVTRVTTRDC